MTTCSFTRTLTRRLLYLLFPATMFLITGCATTGTRLDPAALHQELPPAVGQEIEKRGIYLAHPDDVENVYYLARVATAGNRVYVGYFIEWRGEFPDFGWTYPVPLRERLRQFLLPVYYTNWLYLPRSGGMQRLMFGPGDVEGTGVIYELAQGGMGQALIIRFEMPGHHAFTIPDSAGTWDLPAVFHQGAPCLQLASWNHLFTPPDQKLSPQYFPVHPFPSKQWDRLKMNRRQAEIAKFGLAASARQP